MIVPSVCKQKVRRFAAVAIEAEPNWWKNPAVSAVLAALGIGA
jgi:hypothetical protein